MTTTFKLIASLLFGWIVVTSQAHAKSPTELVKALNASCIVELNGKPTPTITAQLDKEHGVLTLNFAPLGAVQIDGDGGKLASAKPGDENAGLTPEYRTVTLVLKDLSTGMDAKGVGHTDTFRDLFFTRVKEGRPPIVCVDAATGKTRSEEGIHFSTFILKEDGTFLEAFVELIKIYAK